MPRPARRHRGAADSSIANGGAFSQEGWIHERAPQYSHRCGRLRGNRPGRDLYGIDRWQAYALSRAPFSRRTHSPKLLEFGGSEDVQLEDKREADITEARVRYLEDLAQAVFAKARAILQHAGVPVGAVKTHVVSTISGEDVIGNLLEAAQTNTCDTIVVGRQSHSWLRELVQHHLADELIRKAAGFTIWVVE